MIRRFRSLPIITLVALQAGAFTALASPPAAVDMGGVVRELRFKDIRALPRSLDDLGKHDAYVFVFTSTACPLVRKSLPKLVELHRQFAVQNVQFVSVNVGVDDTLRDMAAQAIEYDAPFPFVKDADGSCVRTLGVNRTPTAVVLNAELRLVYRGRIDDQLRLGGTRPEPSRHDLAEALREALAGQPVSLAETLVDGCLITAPPAPPTDAPIPTFYRDVAPVLFRHCSRCHRPDAAAPFSLFTCADATAQAEMIAEVVIDQRMPPWSAHSKPGTFQNDPSLTQAERDTLVRWVRTGRVAGNPEDAPAPPEPPTSKWRIGEPDRVITMLEQHEIPATGYVEYFHTVLPYVFLKDTWIEAVEIRPDNPRVVHHCNMAYVTKQGVGHETFITGQVPGGLPMDLGRFDNGTAVFVPQFAMLGLEIHYTTTGKPENCRIAVGLRYPRGVVHKRLRHFLIDPRRFRIAPGDGAYAVRGSHRLDRDVTLLGLFAHMHLRGKDVTFFANATGRERTTLLQIPNYDFNWQLAYEIEPGRQRLPQGTVIETVAHYDNSPFNPYNPDPQRTVGWGRQTYDEMFNGYGFYVDDAEDLNLTVNPRTGEAIP